MRKLDHRLAGGDQHPGLVADVDVEQHPAALVSRLLLRYPRHRLDHVSRTHRRSQVPARHRDALLGVQRHVQHLDQYLAIARRRQYDLAQREVRRLRLTDRRLQELYLFRQHLRNQAQGAW